MKQTRFTRWLSFILCMALFAAMALFTTGCKDNETEKPADANAGALALPVEDGAELGEGKLSFSLLIADKDGNETNVTVHTDEKTIGDALTSLGILEGEEGPYGLYIKSVNGIAADYDKDGVYWAFYVGEEYASAGVDMTDIEDGASYALKVEK